ncbi:phage portal protein [Nonomuraea sp. MG754425]|uniref:phage portal protein n=1 Tax=Nonomuraea sp. MG754425 TaxID=2570319 RepID=UPI001F2D2846|nr:phage portal protein [Nonomuraea sp. MG754425]MCF6467394.1 phage portal protein [Nonomuraea sp. MG754425]
MPLPDRDQDWPPPHIKREMRLYEEWGAWYAGDPDRLADVYGSTGMVHGIGLDPKGWDRPSKGFSGWIQRAARYFWGTPVPLGQVRSTKLHIPIAGDIAATSADLLFSEQPTLKVPGKTSQKRLDKIMHEAGIYGALLEAAEIGSAYGGSYLRVGWDTEMYDHPVMSVLPPDAAIPEFRYGKLAAVTFWRVLAEDDSSRQVWRHLERHERGRVLHGLYLGTPDRLGKQMPLADHPETEIYADQVDENGGFDSYYPRGLLVSYVPNMRPHRLIRGTSLGRSDYQGVEHLMDALDETWTSLMRDIRLGKGRVIVPDLFLDSLGRGSGAAWDADREIYSGLGMLPPPGAQANSMLTITQFAIRVAEHVDAGKALTAQILRGAGYSAQSFGESDGSGQAVTATEVHSREKKSFSSRGRKTGYWNPTLQWAPDVLLSIDHAVFGRKVSAERGEVHWPDGVQPDPEALGRTVELFNRAQAMSLETKIRTVHPEWDDHQVHEEKERLRDELGLNVPDPDRLDDVLVPSLGEE